MMVEATRLSAAMDIVSSLIFLAASAAAWYLILWRRFKAYDGDWSDYWNNHDTEGWAIGTVVTGGLLATITVAMFFGSYWAVIALFNPELALVISLIQ